MSKQPIFNWDAALGIATCTFEYKNQTFTGLAICHDDDKDMMSEKTGCHIALKRAEIKYYKYLRDCEIKPGLAALKQAYHSMNHGKHANPDSYEIRMLKKQIKIKEEELDEVKSFIIETMGDLDVYLTQKEDFYQSIRKNRQVKDN